GRDESPIAFQHRTPRMPDEDRTWFAIGATWQATDNWDITGAYTRIHIGDDPELDIVSGGARLTGAYDGGANLFGISAQYRFWLQHRCMKKAPLRRGLFSGAAMTAPRSVLHRQQRGVAAGGGGVDGDGFLGGEARQVVRPAGLGAGAGQAAAAEGLHAHHRADLVAVDVDVAHPRPRHDVLHRLVDARVDAQGQAVAGGGDGVDDLVQLARLPADHVQRWAELLVLQLVQRLQLPRPRQEVAAVLQPLAGRGLGDQPGLAVHAPRMFVEHLQRVGIDHRAHGGGQQRRVAHLQPGYRAGQHGDHLVGDVVLHEQDARGRAALAGRGEGRGQHVAHQLLGQRRGV